MNHLKLTQMNKIGYLYVTLAAFLFAVSGTAAKFLFNRGMTPYQMIQLRVTLAFCGLLLWLLLRNRPLLIIDLKDLFYFMLLGILGIGAAQFLYLFAISKITVAAAILLHYTGPVFVAVYAAIFLHQKLTRNSILAIFGTLVGCFLVVGAYSLDLLSLNRSGIIGGILAAVAFATYSLLSEYGMRKYNPRTVLLYGLLFAALIWNILHSPLKALLHTYSPVEWFWILFIATCGTIFPFGLYFEGIKRIRATHASITATLEPISAGVIAAIFLGETMAPLQILGGLLVIASIILLQTKPNPEQGRTKISG
jgi:drug/metabolite transporter (DMT)-like permease